MRPDRIISGGQTGADRGGLDAAIGLGIPHGGYCPKGRKAEDGRIPDRYSMTEHASPEYPPRTEKNIEESDVTILFIAFAKIEGGSALTEKLCMKHSKPILIIDIARKDRIDPATVIMNFMKCFKPKVVNVAGFRESKHPGIQKIVADILTKAMSE